MSNITIKWHGHSCFSVSANDYTIVLDPYAPGSVPGLNDLALTANKVLCSHGHSDHGYTDAVTVVEKADCPFQIQVLESFHDNENGTKRGPNLIHVLEADGLRVVHFGDQGCMPTVEQLDVLKGADAVMIPVGGFYTIDSVVASEIVVALKPTVVVPMHYRTEAFGYPVIAALDDYIEGCTGVVKYDSDTIVITKDMEQQIAVLWPEMA